MKRLLPFCLLFIFSAGALFASVTIQYFTAKSQSDGVLVEWKTTDEQGVSKFVIERSADRPDSFIEIGTINASGSNSFYSFRDQSADYRSTTPVYYYRLKCVEGNGNYSYTNHITVTHAVSSIRSTWGSIKAIFR